MSHSVGHCLAVVAVRLLVERVLDHAEIERGKRVLDADVRQALEAVLVGLRDALRAARGEP